MNLRQTYEQLIANKLKQLPAPDADASWQQMKRLLDDDEDRGAGGRKHPPGNGSGWWRIGILAIVLSASFWLYEKNKAPENAVSKNNAAASLQAGNIPGEANNTNSSANNQTTIIDNTTTLPGSNTSTAAENDAIKSNATADNSLIAAATNNNNNTSAVKTAASTKAGNNTGSTAVNKTPVSGTAYTEGDEPLNNARAKARINNNALSINNKVGKNSTPPGDKPAAGITNNQAAGSNNEKNRIKNNTLNNSSQRKHDLASLTPVKNAGNIPQHTAAWQINENKKNIAAKNSTGADHESDAGYIAEKNPGNIKHQPSGKTKTHAIGDDDNAFTAADDNHNNIAGSRYNAFNQPVAERGKTWLERLTALKTADPIPAFNTSLITGDSIESNLDLNNLLSNETKKSVVKAKRDKEIEDLTRKEKKSFHLNLGNVFKPFSLHLDAEPRWAAGIGLNNGITMQAQSRFNYNMNGKSGTLSDYIPSLYLQFHLNDYVYMQTELNFISPQYTPQLLLYQYSNDMGVQAAGMSQQKSIYVKKLYYFNLPVSLHYSPINNLYFSAGLQFSSFQSGLAAIEQKQYQTVLGPDHASNTSTSILKFKDDSIAAQIAPNEWRWQVGADYYWNRFSVGLRYNQSFKNAINTVVLPASPATKLRNESLIFFVRYNLFESRKKGNADQKN